VQGHGSQESKQAAAATQRGSVRMVGFNKNAFKPQIAAIKDKYYEMFRNKTKS